jgi:hypothetical protein
MAKMKTWFQVKKRRKGNWSGHIGNVAQWTRGRYAGVKKIDGSTLEVAASDAEDSAAEAAAAAESSACMLQSRDGLCGQSAFAARRGRERLAATGSALHVWRATAIVEWEVCRRASTSSAIIRSVSIATAVSQAAAASTSP